MTDTPAPTEVPDRPLPTTVIGAIAAVMAEIGGIPKLSPEQRKHLGLSGGDASGITYAYRGIDQLAQKAQPLFGTYGVVIVPNIIDQRIEHIAVRNNPWTDTFLEVEWTIYGPGGADDKIVSITTGQGRDNSDKGINKALTGAFKNLLLRILCIGDPQDDPDNERHETQANVSPEEMAERQAEIERQKAEDEEKLAKADLVKGLFERIRNSPAEVKEHCKAVAAEFAVNLPESRVGKLTELNIAEVDALREQLVAYFDDLDRLADDSQLTEDEVVERVAEELGGELTDEAEPEQPTTKRKNRTAKQIADDAAAEAAAKGESTDG